MSYFNKEALEEFNSLHKFYKLVTVGGEVPGSTKTAIGGGGVSSGTSSGGSGTPKTGDTRINANGVEETYIEGIGWVTVPGGDDPGGNSPGGYPPRTVAEDLEFLRGKYPIDVKLLEAEYRLMVNRDAAGFKNDRVLAQMGFKNDRELAQMDIKAKKEYLIEQMKLTKDMELELMIQSHTNSLELQQDMQTFQKVMAADDRTFQAEQAGLNREFDVAIANMNIGAQQALQAAQLAAQQAMQQAGFSHAEAMQAGQQAFDKALQESGFEHEIKMQDKELAMRLTLSNNEIQSQEKIAKERNELDLKLQENQQKFEKEQREEDRKAELRKEVNELRGRDPVRAALLAMGVGDPTNPLGGDFAGMAPIEGSEELQANTESALQGIQGLGQKGQTISLGEQGVSGLQNVEKAATSFQYMDAPQKTLITSAHGIGNQDRAGLSEEAVQERISAVTPKGFERAADGRGLETVPTGGGRRGTAPVNSNTIYEVGEQGPETLVVGDNKELEKIIPESVTSLPDSFGEQVPNLDHPTSTGLNPVPVETKPDVDPFTTIFNDPNYTLNKDIGANTQPYRGGQDIGFQGGPEVEARNKYLAEQESLFASIGISKEDYKRALMESRDNGTPLNPHIQEIHKKLIDLNRSYMGQFGNRGLPIQPTWDRGNIEPYRLPPLNGDNPNQKNQIALEQRRRQYLASLPPAQRAALVQQDQLRKKEQQQKLLNSLNPETISQLMNLINNPNRAVDNNLQEQLPQIRDGAGNITSTPTRAPLASVV